MSSFHASTPKFTFHPQNCQETEESLEELKSKFNEAKAKMDEEAANLKSQIEHIKVKIGVEEGKKKLLMQRMAATKDARNQEVWA